MRAVAVISVALFAAAGPSGVSRTDYLNAKKKFQAIDKQR